MAAYSQTGKVVNVGDRVSIIGVISSVTSPVNENSSVVIQPPLSATTFTANALDVHVVESAGNGPSYGNLPTAGLDCTTTGVVTAIAGSGNTATLTVTLTTSGLSVSVPAGACISDGF